MGRIGSDAPAALVPGTRLSATRLVRRDGGRVLLGGSPRRLLRLSDAGASLAADLLAGRPATSGPARTLGRRLADAGLARAYPPAGPRPSVAVLIPVRDRPLGDLLDALGDRDPVVVVDDGSRNPVRVDRPHVTVLRLGTSLGPAGARMHGLAHLARLDTDVVACLDSDVLVPVGWLEPLLAHLADPRVAAVAPRVRPEVPATVLGRYLEGRSPLDMGPLDVPVRPGSPVAYVPTAALVVRRRLASFDPALRYGEDVDLVWRLVAAGHEVRYEPRVEVRHREPRRWAAALRRRHAYGTAAAPLAERHPGGSAHLVATPLPLGAAVAVAVAPLPVAAATAVLATAVCAARLHRAGVPARDALAMAAAANAHAASGLSRYATQLAGPLVLLALRRRPVRTALLLALPGLWDWARRRPPLDPLRFVAAGVVDDVAYGLGVWRGCRRQGSLAPVRPRVR